MTRIHQKIKHESGITLGGMGTGTVEIHPDGLFRYWNILNLGPWSKSCGPFVAEEDLLGQHHLVFLVRTKTSDGDIQVRHLAVNRSMQGDYPFVMLSWAGCVEEIVYDGRFPVAKLSYHDEDLPVEIEAEVFSPFIPNDSKNSGMPGFYVNFKLRSRVADPVEVSILGSINNAAGFGQESRVPYNTLHASEDRVAVTLSADGLDTNHRTTGNMAFSVSGGDLSYVTGAYQVEDRIIDWYSVYGPAVYSYLHSLRDEGKLPNTNAQYAPSFDIDTASLSFEELKEIYAKMMEYAFIHEKSQRVKDVIPDLESDPDKLRAFVDDFKKAAETLQEEVWGKSVLCSKFSLSPDQTQETLFTVSWFFPNHMTETGEKIGHVYENWFNDALEVNDHLASNFAEFRTKTQLMPNLIYNSDIPAELADAVTSQLTTLTKSSWWDKDGHFGIWEGLGSCGLHTMDITYAGSFPIIAMFPDIQKEQISHGAKFQREDGRVHHFFTTDFYHTDDGFERVDMNPQFVMMVAREYMWSADKDFLKEMWPHVVSAMDNTSKLDSDGDGLPDTDTKRNTYDLWDFSGASSFLCSLWLGSLKAAVLLANEMGDQQRANDWQQILERGAANMEAKLWNGNYYTLWIDEKAGTRDDCCMSDQMSGEWFCSISGLGSILDADRVKQALKSIYKFNFKRGTGLINGSCPPNIDKRFPTYGSLQAGSNWTGIEYMTAALMVEHGLIDEAYAIVHDIDRRHFRAGRAWNHEECGAHYYRAMASWSIMIALSGFRYNALTGHLQFTPKKAGEYPFFVPGACGLCRTTENGVEIEVKAGSLRCNSFDLGNAAICNCAVELPVVLNAGDTFFLPQSK